LKIAQRLNADWRMLMDKELIQFLEERNALFTNPNLADATKWWVRNNLPTPARPDVPLAAVHKARLQWLDATDDMLAQSIMWLEANGFSTNWQDAPPLTPAKRDADRVSVGKEPLNTEGKS
jgi:hypothetical protein